MTGRMESMFCLVETMTNRPGSMLDRPGSMKCGPASMHGSIASTGGRPASRDCQLGSVPSPGGPTRGLPRVGLSGRGERQRHRHPTRRGRRVGAPEMPHLVSARRMVLRRARVHGRRPDIDPCCRTGRRCGQGTRRRTFGDRIGCEPPRTRRLTNRAGGRARERAQRSTRSRRSPERIRVAMPASWGTSWCIPKSSR